MKYEEEGIFARKLMDEGRDKYTRGLHSFTDILRKIVGEGWTEVDYEKYCIRIGMDGRKVFTLKQYILVIDDIEARDCFLVRGWSWRKCVDLALDHRRAPISWTRMTKQLLTSLIERSNNLSAIIDGIEEVMAHYNEDND